MAYQQAYPSGDVVTVLPPYSSRQVTEARSSADARVTSSSTRSVRTSTIAQLMGMIMLPSGTIDHTSLSSAARCSTVNSLVSLISAELNQAARIDRPLTPGPAAGKPHPRAAATSRLRSSSGWLSPMHRSITTVSPAASATTPLGHDSELLITAPGADLDRVIGLLWRLRSWTNLDCSGMADTRTEAVRLAMRPCLSPG
jgi:hypothetical protein